MTGQEGGGAGTLAAALIETLLGEERSRASSLEDRGIRAITTSAALVTLFGGLAALGGVSHVAVGRSGAVVAGAAALALFVVSAAAGILANLPLGYQVADVGDIHAGPDGAPVIPSKGLASYLQPELFWAPKSTVERRLAEVRAIELRSLRDANARRTVSLIVALVAQVSGLIALGLWLSLTVAGP